MIEDTTFGCIPLGDLWGPPGGCCGCGKLSVTNLFMSHSRIENNKTSIAITCKDRLVGRFLSIQKKEMDKFTVLEVDGISYSPKPSNYLVPNFNLLSLINE